MDRSRILAVLSGVAAAAGGAATLLSLSTGRGFVGDDESTTTVITHAPETATAIGVVVAVLVAAALAERSRRMSAGVAMIGLVGVCVTVDAAIVSPSAAIGISALAGLALGGLVGWVTHRSDLLTTALAAGSVVGVVISRPLRHPFELVLRGPAPDHVVDTRSVGIVLAAIAAVALVPAALASEGNPVGPRRHPLGVAICLGVTAVAWLLAIWFEAAMPIRGWCWGWVLVPAVIAAALVLRDRGGSSLLTIAAAWAVLHSADLSYIPGLTWLLALIPLAALGVAVGRRTDRPELLVALLIPCAATWLITGGPLTRTFSVLALFVVPVVVIAALTGEIRRRRTVPPEVVAVALTSAALWVTSPRVVVFVVAGFGDGSRSFDTGRYTVPQSVSLAAEYVVPAVVSLVICVIALRVLRRRAPDA